MFKFNPRYSIAGGPSIFFLQMTSMNSRVDDESQEEIEEVKSDMEKSGTNPDPNSQPASLLSSTQAIP